jgi:hypothetical protein
MIGAPVWMLGFTMPLKQTFSLLPQLVTSGFIRKLQIRKTVWTVSALVQAVCLLLMIPSAIYLTPVSAGFAVMLLLIVFSTASGAASVAFQDVMGKTVSKGRRGRLLSSRAFVGGIFTIAAGFILSGLKKGGGEDILFILIAAGSFLWVCSSAAFQNIVESKGATQGARNPIDETGAGVGFFREYPGFRKYMYARSLLLVLEIAVPFYVYFASVRLGTAKTGIGMFITAIGVSQVISSPFWGKIADKTSRRVMIQSAVISAAAAGIAVISVFFTNSGVIYACLLVSFVLMGLAEAGVRLGRKTYLVDAAPKDERVVFTAFSNSVIGILSFFSGLLGIVAEKSGSLGIIIVLGILSLFAAYTSYRMPEAGDMLGR